MDPCVFDRLEELLRQKGVDVERNELEACFPQLLEEHPDIRLQLIREQIENAIEVLDSLFGQNLQEEDEGTARVEVFWQLQQALELIPERE